MSVSLETTQLLADITAVSQRITCVRAQHLGTLDDYTRLLQINECSVDLEPLCRFSHMASKLEDQMKLLLKMASFMTLSDLECIRMYLCKIDNMLTMHEKFHSTVMIQCTTISQLLNDITCISCHLSNLDHDFSLPCINTLQTKIHCLKSYASKLDVVRLQLFHTTSC